MNYKRLAITCLALSLSAMTASAADWQAVYHGAAKGAYFLDKDSVADASGGVKRFWTLFAPRVTVGQPGETYAYVKRLSGINCGAREITQFEAIYTDGAGQDHPAEIKLDKNPYVIVPDTEEDFWWSYLCKPHTAKELADLGQPITSKNMRSYLAGQLRFLNENNALVNRNRGR